MVSKLQQSGPGRYSIEIIHGMKMLNLPWRTCIIISTDPSAGIGSLNVRCIEFKV